MLINNWVVSNNFFEASAADNSFFSASVRQPNRKQTRIFPPETRHIGRQIGTESLSLRRNGCPAQQPGRTVRNILIQPSYDTRTRGGLKIRCCEQEPVHRDLRLPNERGRQRSGGIRHANGRLPGVRPAGRCRRRIPQHMLRARQCGAENHQPAGGAARAAQQEETRTHHRRPGLHGGKGEGQPHREPPRGPRGRSGCLPDAA